MVNRLLYKEDWQETKERYIQWWNHEYFGRCALAVTAPRKNPGKVDPPPPPTSPEQRWFDLDWISRQNEYVMSHTFYGGEAFPVWNAGYSGVTGLPTLLGCPIDIDMTTGWWHPILTDPDHIDYQRLGLDENHPNYQFAMKMLRRAVEESRGKCIPSIGAFGATGDTLAALRGTEQLLIDCIERPDEVRAAEEYLLDIWIDFYDRCYQIVHEVSEGSTCWFELWAPGKFYAPQNDFSYNIGQKMFNEIFLDVIRRQTEFLDYSIYHVDGVNSFKHIDALLTLPRLQAFQIVPGAGKPSPLYYMDVLKKVQNAGKNLQIYIPPCEVEPALRELSARGLFIHTWAETEDQARELLKNAEKWSVDRG